MHSVNSALFAEEPTKHFLQFSSVVLESNQVVFAGWLLLSIHLLSC